MIDTKKLEILVKMLEKAASADVLSPEQHAEALDIETQAQVESSVLQGSIASLLSELGDKISQVEVIVPEPEDAEEEQPKTKVDINVRRNN